MRPLEGGGKSNGSFLRAGLIDEISLAVCPAVDGARGGPYAFDSREDEIYARAPLRSSACASGLVELSKSLERFRNCYCSPCCVDVAWNPR